MNIENIKIGDWIKFDESRYTIMFIEYVQNRIYLAEGFVNHEYLPRDRANYQVYLTPEDIEQNVTYERRLLVNNLVDL